MPTKDSENPVRSKGIYDSILGNTELLRQTIGYTRKNLFNNNHATETINGITFTVGTDKIITAVGEATNDALYSVSFTLPVGDYILSGAPEGSDQ